MRYALLRAEASALEGGGGGGEAGRVVNVHALYPRRDESAVEGISGTVGVDRVHGEHGIAQLPAVLPDEAASRTLRDYQRFGMICLIQLCGCVRGCGAAGYFQRELLRRDEHVVIWEQALNAGIGAAGIVADLYAELVRFFCRVYRGVELVAVKMEVLCVFQDAEVYILT